MELKYRRRMRMPVWSLPGFLYGKYGEIGPSQNTMQVSNNNLIANNLDGTTIGYPDLKPSWTPNSNWQPDLGWYPQTGTTQPTVFNGNVNMNLGYGNQSAYQKWTKSGGSDYSGFNKVDLTNAVQGPKNLQGAGSFQPKGGKSIPAGTWGQIGQSAIQFAGSVANSFGPVKTEKDLETNTGYTTTNGAGYQWNRQNQIDRVAEMRELNQDNTSRTLATAAAGVGLGAGVGAAIGGAAGPIGAAAGAIIGLTIGLIGGANRKAKMRRRIYNAQQNIIRKNSWESASVQTDYLANDWNNKYGSSYDDNLYGAKEGKNPGDIINQNASTKLKVKEFNRKLTLPNMKQNNDVQQYKQSKRNMVVYR